MLLAKDPNGRDYSLNHSGQNIPVAKAKNAVSSGDIIDIKSAIISGKRIHCSNGRTIFN